MYIAEITRYFKMDSKVFNVKVFWCAISKVHTKVVMYVQKSIEEKIKFSGNDIDFNAAPLKATNEVPIAKHKNKYTTLTC